MCIRDRAMVVEAPGTLVVVVEIGTILLLALVAAVALLGTSNPLGLMAATVVS